MLGGVAPVGNGLAVPTKLTVGSCHDPAAPLPGTRPEQWKQGLHGARTSHTQQPHDQQKLEAAHAPADHAQISSLRPVRTRGGVRKRRDIHTPVTPGTSIETTAPREISQTHTEGPVLRDSASARSRDRPGPRWRAQSSSDRAGHGWLVGAPVSGKEKFAWSQQSWWHSNVDLTSATEL